MRPPVLWRTRQALKHCPQADQLDHYGVMAARRLFSVFADLEYIAVVAAERGDCIQGQLADERVHKSTFGKLAERYGGYQEPSEPVRALVQYLTSLHGAESLAGLNLVGEHWLEQIFHALEASVFGPLFEVFEQDEARHAHLAFDLPKPDPVTFTPILRDIEQLLSDVSRAPDFVIPLSYFLPPFEVGRMAVKQTHAHRRVCEHLGIEPGEGIQHIYRDARRLIIMSVRYPVVELHPNAWEGQKLTMWRDVHPMMASTDMECSYADDYGRVEFEVARAAAKALKEIHELNRVTRRGKLFQLSAPVVGVRRTHNGENILTVPFSYLPDEEKTKKTFRARLDEARSRPYEGTTCNGNMQRAGELYALLPPAPYAVTVTQVSPFGFDTGWAPIDAVEGATTALTITSPGPGKIRIGMVTDHRVLDGKHMGLLFRALKEDIND